MFVKLSLVAIFILLLNSCTPTKGEIDVFVIKKDQGIITLKEHFSKLKKKDNKLLFNEGSGEVIRQNDNVKIVLHQPYMRYFSAISGEILIYAEVAQYHNNEKIIKRIVMELEEVAQDSRLGPSFTITIPPFRWNGEKCAVRLRIIELDQQENQELKKVVENVQGMVNAAQPQYAIITGMVGQIINSLIDLNKDDIEFDKTITFHPIGDQVVEREKAPNYLYAPFMTGTYLFVKSENPHRVVPYANEAEYCYSIAKLPVFFMAYSFDLLSQVVTLGNFSLRKDWSAYAKLQDKVYPYGQHVDYDSTAQKSFDYSQYKLSSDLEKLVKNGTKDPYKEKSYLVLSIAKSLDYVPESILETLSQQEEKRFKELTFRSGDLMKNLEELQLFITSLNAKKAVEQEVSQIPKNDPRQIKIILDVLKQYPERAELQSELLTMLNKRVTGRLFTSRDIGNMLQQGSEFNTDSVTYQPEKDIFVINDKAIFNPTMFQISPQDIAAGQSTEISIVKGNISEIKKVVIKGIDHEIANGKFTISDIPKGIYDVALIAEKNIETIKKGITAWEKTEITDISPVIGSKDGETIIKITGDNFVAGKTTVMIGDKTAEEIKIHNPNTISCKTPKVTSPGEVSIKVTTFEGISEFENIENTTKKFVYMEIPSITSAVKSGNIVTINGSNFVKDNTDVYIGSKQVEITSLTSNEIKCKMPSSPTDNKVYLSTFFKANTGKKLTSNSIEYTGQ